MKNYQDMVKEFHMEFGISVMPVPCIPEKKISLLRCRLILEELEELVEAFDQNDIIEVADAIGDLLYVVLGTAVSCGINIQPIFEEIHRSNMTKKGGVLREDGKLIKPPTYSPPNIKDILLEQLNKF